MTPESSPTFLCPSPVHPPHPLLACSWPKRTMQNMDCLVWDHLCLYNAITNSLFTDIRWGFCLTSDFRASSSSCVTFCRPWAEPGGVMIDAKSPGRGAVGSQWKRETTQCCRWRGRVMKYKKVAGGADGWGWDCHWVNPGSSLRSLAVLSPLFISCGITSSRVCARRGYLPQYMTIRCTLTHTLKSLLELNVTEGAPTAPGNRSPSYFISLLSPSTLLKRPCSKALWEVARRPVGEKTRGWWGEENPPSDSDWIISVIF